LLNGFTCHQDQLLILGAKTILSMQFAQELFKEERLNGKLKYDSKKQGR